MNLLYVNERDVSIGISENRCKAKYKEALQQKFRSKRWKVQFRGMHR